MSLPDWNCEWTHEKLLQLLLMKVNRVTCSHRHGDKPSTRDLDTLANIQIDIEQELGMLPKDTN
jgi:hypothetical protein